MQINCVPATIQNPIWTFPQSLATDDLREEHSFGDIFGAGPFFCLLRLSALRPCLPEQSQESAKFLGIPLYQRTFPHGQNARSPSPRGHDNLCRGFLAFVLAPAQMEPGEGDVFLVGNLHRHHRAYHALADAAHSVANVHALL